MSVRNCWVAVWVASSLRTEVPCVPSAQQCRTRSHHSFCGCAFRNSSGQGAELCRKGLCQGWQWSFSNRDSVFGIHFCIGWGKIDEWWNELELLCRYCTVSPRIALNVQAEQEWRAAPKLALRSSVQSEPCAEGQVWVAWELCFCMNAQRRLKMNLCVGDVLNWGF